MNKMKHGLFKGLIVTIGFMASNLPAAVSPAVGRVIPNAPGSFANCEVLNYSTSTGTVGRVVLNAPSGGVGTRRPAAKLLSSSPGDETVETWVVRSPANAKQTYAVRRTRLASGEISMCAYTPNRVLATLVAGKSYATFVQEMAAKGLTVVRELMRDLDGNAVYVIEAAETENDIVEQMTMSIESTGSCSLVRPDHIYEANAAPNDTYYSSQWALEKIGAPQAWDTRTDASSVLVAVLDTGVNYNHYDLNRSMWINDGEILGDGIDNDGNGFVDDIYGMSCIGGNVSGDSMDDNGHGSHCAGIIGAAGNNRQWISGVAWRAKVMGLKFLNSEGKGAVSDAITCLCYAEMMGVKVVNCSFGSTDWDDYLYIQMKKMSQNGTIFVCAAGNAEPGMSPRDNDEYPFYPCNYSVDTLVSVAATDQNDALANFSYYGAQNVDIAAPGVNINSTVLGTYGLDYKDGTSMATPHVAGALALLIAHYPGDTPLQIIDRLYAAAEPVPALVGKVRTGARLSMAGFFGIPAPEEISVTQGSIADAVVVYWTAVNGGTHYRVWRAASEGGEKTMLCDWQQGLTFSDETAEPGVTYWYYLQAAASINGASASTYSIGVSGFRPEIDMSRITVSFDPAGGTVSPASKVYRVGETYSQMPVPTYSGKTFLGWFTEADGGTRLDEPSLVRADATTLHAHWIGSDVLRVMNLFARQRYPWNGYVDVTFDLAGVPEDETASVSLTAQEESGGSPLALRTFVGPAPTNLVNGAQHVVWNATPDTQGILYTNMILAATVVIDEKPLLPPTNVTASNGTDADAVVVSWSASENATSYEVWRAAANDVTSAGLIATPTDTSYRDTSAVPATTYWYWVKAVNAKKTSEFSASASGSRKKIVTGITISGASSVTAGGTASYTCTATYNDNATAAVTPTWSITSGSSYASINSSGTLTANGTATQRSVTIQASYSYNGSTQTMTKSVTINTKSVTISFNANGGSVSPSSQSYTAYGSYGSLPTPSRDGYTFVGWFTELSGGALVTASSVVPAADATLYAHWTENTPIWTIDEHGTLIAVDLNGATEIIIPSTVKSIGTNVFESCSGLTSVVVPQGVTNIGASAFISCRNLESINIPSGVICIGELAFQWCSKLNAVLLPAGLREIGRQAFYQCEQLSNLRIPSTVDSVQQSAFSGCCNLRDVIIEDGVLDIGNGVFSDCNSLTNVVMASTIRDIGNSAFHNCALSDFNVPAAVTNVGNSAFSRCASLTRVTVPRDVKFGAFAFEYCTKLSDVFFEEGVTEVPNAMFEFCKNLTNVVMASTIGNIGDSAFSYCESLKDIYISEGVTNIASFAFERCKSLVTVTMPSNVRKIGYGAFSYCPKLVSVTIMGELDSYENDPYGSSSYNGTPASLTTFVTANWTGPTDTWQGRAVEFLKHTISFNANGGNVAPLSTIMNVGDTYGFLPEPSRDGYSFVGWFTEASGGTQVTTMSIVPTYDITLYAHWKLPAPILTISASPTNVIAVWTTSTDAKYYEIYRSTNVTFSAATMIATVNNLTYTDTPILNDNTTYYYWVRAVGTSSSSDESNASHIHTYKTSGTYTLLIPAGNHAISLVGGGGGGVHTRGSVDMTGGSGVYGVYERYIGGGSGAAFSGVLNLAGSIYTIKVGKCGAGYSLGIGNKVSSVPSISAEDGESTYLRTALGVEVIAAGCGKGARIVGGVLGSELVEVGQGGMMSTNNVTIVSCSVNSSGNSGTWNKYGPSALGGGSVFNGIFGKGGDATSLYGRDGNGGFFQIVINE